MTTHHHEETRMDDDIETITDRAAIRGVAAHRDNLSAMVQRLSEFLDSRSLNSWKHGACWAAEDAIKRLTERAEIAEDTLRLQSDALARVTREAEVLRAQVAAVEALVGAWEACDSSDFRSGPLRAALATTGEGE